MIAIVLFVFSFIACTSAPTSTQSSTTAQQSEKQVVIQSQNTQANQQVTKPVFPKQVEIVIKDARFNPDEIAINLGDTLLWTNEDGSVHTVLIEGGVESPSLHKHDSWNYTFAQRGVYHYRCGIHPNMIGTIVVQ